MRQVLKKIVPSLHNIKLADFLLKKLIKNTLHDSIFSITKLANFRTKQFTILNSNFSF